jgi:hypothetical protein
MGMMSALSAMLRGERPAAAGDGNDALADHVDPYLVALLQGACPAEPNDVPLGEHGCAVDIIRGQAG